MNQTTQKFLILLENRSNENKESISLLMQNGLLGNAISVLRQEIDSFIRVVYLAQMTDFSYREELMNRTLNGEKWTEEGKRRRITDREMVDITSNLKGYVQYAYKFGCSFIHLSDSHNYQEKDPFDSLPIQEQRDIAFYLNYYHGFPMETKLSIESVKPLILSIFDKITNNMWCYTNHLKEGTVLVDY
ncbi:MAG: hypothetical protein R2824_24345 [Saprospiraceae bacterium]|nr:hypothetical protein [Lewinella sp.]